MKLEPHPIAEIFPLIEGQAFDEFVEDIRRHGQREPVTLYEGKVLDGRNRLRALQRLSIEPLTVEWDGEDPLAFVVSKNLRRRHLKDSQRALIAARIANLPHGWKGRQRGAGLPGDVTRADAAEMLNVKPRTLDWGRFVHSHAAPEVQRLVEKGHLSVSAAGKVAHLSQREQVRLAAEGPSSIVAKARKLDGLKGRQGRAEYSILWGLLDEIHAGLAGQRLDTARSAAAGLIAEIDRIAAERRA